MTTNFYLDRRQATESSDLCQIKIALNHGGTSSYISTGVRVPSDAWEAKPQRIVKTYPNAARLNILISTKKLDVDNAIEALRKSGKLKGLSLPKIRRAILDFLSPEKQIETEGLFMARMQRYRDTRKTIGTQRTYDDTMRRIRDFDKRADKLTFNDITHGWLTEFDRFMEMTAPSANARSVRLRCVRAVVNDAKRDKLIADYPFDTFKIRNEATEDRSLTAEHLRQLFSYPCEVWQRQYLDIFRLSFFLTGLNIIDIANLREMKNGRIQGRRAKTGQPFSVRVEPEALDIVNRYRGKGWLLDIRDRYSDEKDYLHRLNYALKRIGTHYDPHTKVRSGEPLFPGLSSYYARYSWANIAAELDVPNEVIDAALGHKARGVISVYVRLNYNRKVDEANRRVIDFVLNGGK